MSPRDDQPRDALATLDPLLRQPEPDAGALDVVSNAAEKLGDTPCAVELLRQAIVINPGKIEYYLDSATLAFDHASFQVGIDMLNVSHRA